MHTEARTHHAEAKADLADTVVLVVVGKATTRQTLTDNAIIVANTTNSVETIAQLQAKHAVTVV